MLFDLKARDFCAWNWTYSPAWKEILGLQSSDQRFPIVECVRCNFVFAGLLPSDEFLKRVYDEVIDQDRAWRASQELTDIARRHRYLAQTIPLLDKSEAPNALDYGCGFGMTLRLLDASGVRVFGFDPSDTRVGRLKAAGLNVTSSPDAVRAQMPYNLIICDNVLEHVTKPHDTIAGLAQVSLPGTVLYVSVPSYEARTIARLKAEHAAGSLQDMSLNPWEHVNYFRLHHLDGMLSKSGFWPIRSDELSGHVDIGLRPEKDLARRTKNCFASGARLISYAIGSEGVESVESRFYRFTGSDA